jgi:hypothetical protein
VFGDGPDVTGIASDRLAHTLELDERSRDMHQ